MESGCQYFTVFDLLHDCNKSLEESRCIVNTVFYLTTNSATSIFNKFII